MLKQIFSILFLFTLVFELHAEDPQETLQLANAAYQSGAYTKAIDGYKALLDQGWGSGDLEYNLGSSYLQTKAIGPAILHLERALLQSPSDTDIQHNLQLAREQLTDDISEVPEFFLRRWWNAWAMLAPATVWSILGLLILWLSIAGLVMWLLGWQRSLRKWGFLGGIPLLLLGGVLLLLAFSRMKMEQNAPYAILQAAQTTLYSAPDEASNALFDLHEGTKVKLLDQIGEWHKVRLLNGDQGWLPAKVMERI